MVSILAFNRITYHKEPAKHKMVVCRGKCAKETRSAQQKLAAQIEETRVAATKYFDASDIIVKMKGLLVEAADHLREADEQIAAEMDAIEILMDIIGDTDRKLKPLLESKETLEKLSAERYQTNKRLVADKLELNRQLAKTQGKWSLVIHSHKSNC